MFKKVLRTAASIKITITCVLALFLLVVWGTFYQVDYGIYAAQKHIFASWFFIEFGFIPFPGIKTVITLLTINLLASSLRVFNFNFRKTGIFLIHLGVIILIAGSGFAASLVNESTVSLLEGENTSVATKQYDWEIAFFRKSKGIITNIGRKNVSGLKKGDNLEFKDYGININILEFYANCTGYGTNPHTIESLLSKPPEKNGRNFPGVVVNIQNKLNGGGEVPRMILFSGSEAPAIFAFGSDTLMGILQQAQVLLPFTVKLEKFTKIDHPGTREAKSYQSLITISNNTINREALISMNRPFRYKTITFYQTGFSQQGEAMSSTLSVVDNPMRFVPYLSSIIVILGLLYHYILSFYTYIKKVK
ncbi:MAG: cytochrome c biogenesis protein ResB [Chitinispirillaceae bacterium]|nr:cytochrome c biogenesis protein ResB [Chitinispirillaceae bacterium]